MSSETQSDTIAAIITAPGEAGVAVVRISGNAAHEIADAIVRCHGDPPSQRPPNTFLHGYVKNPDGNTDLDEVIVLIYHAPHSYTRENVIELQGHGGATSAKRILRTVLKAGARPAQPGEFTKRAFLNGRIDLLQAEAVMDLIQSRSDRAADAALEQLEGNLSRSFSDIYDNLISVAADLEATLDFGEDELPTKTFDAIILNISEIQKKLEKLLADWDEGHLLREGALVVISGSPNVGKSTLLNSLLGKERAIVTHLAGTTRDTLEEQLVLEGIPIRLVDTAGLRQTECNIEQEGIRRAQHKIERADVNLAVIDGSNLLSEEEQKIIQGLPPKRSIVVINKSDIGLKIDESYFAHIKTVKCSGLTGQGIDELRQAIVETLGISGNTTTHASISERHRLVIKKVMQYINETLTILKRDDEELTAMAAETLRSALDDLGEITGRNYHDELLDSVFGKFCVGK